MGKRLVPIVQNVPVVPIVGDMPEIIILPELWRNTSVVVPDCSPHVVQRGVPRTGTSPWRNEGGWQKGKKRK